MDPGSTPLAGTSSRLCGYGFDTLYPGWVLFILGAAGGLFGQAELHRLVGLDAAPHDRFGVAVAMDEAWLAVGSLDDRMAGANVGAIYLFEPETGRPIRKIVAPDAAPLDQFGASVALAGDALWVGAPGRDANGVNSGAVYGFELADGAFRRLLVPGDGSALDAFGNAIAARDGYLLVGAFEDDEGGEGKGSVYVFDAAGEAELHKLVAGDGADFDGFGYSIALFRNLGVVGAPLAADAAGKAYLFSLLTGREEAVLSPHEGAVLDRFGSAVAVDGTHAAVGAPGHDAAGQDAGAVYVFDLASGTERRKLTASDAEPFAAFGTSVAVQGDWLVVGAPGASADGVPVGALYAFDLSTGTELFRVTARAAVSGDRMGQSLAFGGSRFAAGAADAAEETGAVVVFSRKPLVLRPLSTNMIEVAFAGTLQSSGDLINWSDVSPPPVGVLSVSPPDSPRYFRVRD